MTIKEKIENLLLTDRLDLAIELMMEKVKNIDSDTYNSLILINSAVVSNENDNINGIISREDYKRTKAQRLYALQHLITNLDNEILNSATDDLIAENQNTAITSKQMPEGTDPLDRKYKLPNIQKLLMGAFDDAGFNQFCMFYFDDIYNSFADGQGKNQKVMKLLDYCKRFLKFQYLLDNVQDTNQAQFEMYKPYY